MQRSIADLVGVLGSNGIKSHELRAVENKIRHRLKGNNTSLASANRYENRE